LRQSRPAQGKSNSLESLAFPEPLHPVSGGAEKEKGSRTSWMIAMLVFFGPLIA
jgi:hypothetical protein